MRKSWLSSAIGFGLITAGAAAIGTLATRRSIPSGWYENLRKPSFQPPRGAFGPVWTALYSLIAGSGARVWRTKPGPERTRALALWGTQLALNAGWPALFFGARKPKAALYEIGLLLASIAAYTAIARKADKKAAWMVAPYLVWTGFATAINADLVRLNPELAN